MKKYELLLVLPGTLDENEAGVRAEEIIKLVKEHGEEVENTKMGKSRLAYPIKQIRYGYFYAITFTADSEKLKVLKEKLELQRDLLRSIITHFNAGYTASQKIVYATDASGMTVMRETETVTAADDKAEKVAIPDKNVKVDLADIDKRLDEILGSETLMP
jgi:ribosomal protein S6